MEDPTRENHLTLFHHMTDYTARKHFKSHTITSSSYLDVDITDDQIDLLHPSALDCISGYIMDGLVGRNSKKRLAKRRLNMVDANISSYCVLLNGIERIELVREVNELAAACGEVSKEVEEKREERANEKERKQKESKEKKAAVERQELEKRAEAEIMNDTILNEIKTRGIEHIKTLSVKQLQSLLQFHWNHPAGKKAGLKKVERYAVAVDLYARDLVDEDDEVQEGSL